MKKIKKIKKNNKKLKKKKTNVSSQVVKSTYKHNVFKSNEEKVKIKKVLKQPNEK